MHDLLCDDDSARSLPIKQDERMGGVRACWAGMAASCAREALRPAVGLLLPVIVADATNVLVESEAQVHALMRQAPHPP